MQKHYHDLNGKSFLQWPDFLCFVLLVATIRKTIRSVNLTLLLMMPISSPVRRTILALVAVTCKREQHRNTFKEAPVWNRPNTLRRSSQKCFYNSRVLERSWLRVPFMRVLGPFYSGEVLPPILVEQVSHPCRASFSSL